MKSTRPDFATIVQITGLSEGLRGAPRPGHFDGVATVVTKRLIQSLPDVAYFGEKDYQQLLVVRRVARDLDIPVRIAGVTTIREPDALALSSRSAYRSPEEGRTAPNPGHIAAGRHGTGRRRARCGAAVRSPRPGVQCGRRGTRRFRWGSERGCTQRRSSRCRRWRERTGIARSKGPEPLRRVIMRG
jgi:hypothetical protein